MAEKIVTPNPDPPQEPVKDPKIKKKTEKRGRKKKVTIPEIKLDISATLVIFTKAIAESSGNPAWIMQDDEAKNLVRALNEYLKIRFIYIEKFYPELALAVPIGVYLIRVAHDTKTKKKVKTEEGKDD